MEPTSLPPENQPPIAPEGLPDIPGAPSDTPPTPSGPPNLLDRLKALLRNRRAVIIIAVILVGLLAGGAYLFTRKPNPTSATTDSGLQDVGIDQLKNFTDSLTPTTTQVVTINANGKFSNNLTVDKLLTAGAITTSALNIAGATTLDSVNVKSNIFVTGGSTLQGNIEARGQLTVRGTLAATNASFSGNVAVAGNLTAGSFAAGTLTVNTLTVNNLLTVNGHLASAGITVSVTPGPILGGGSSATVTGNDTAGTVVINSGAGPTGGGQMATIRFHTAFPSTPHVLLTPVGPSAGGLQWSVTRNSNFFTIESVGTPPANKQFVFDYFVIQ